MQMKGELSGRLEAGAGAAARLARDNGCLEGQVEQLTSSLVDATAKRSAAEQRLRQFQQVCSHSVRFQGF